MVKATQTPVHEMTAALIGEATAAKYRDLMVTRETLAAEFPYGTPQPEVLPPEDRRVTITMPKEIVSSVPLNGYAEDSLFLLPSDARSRKRQLERKVAALQLVIETLGRSELIARSVEAAEWLQQNEAKWSATCRDIILCCEHLQALEARAVRERSTVVECEPADLPLARYIGNGRSVLGVLWASDPLSRVRAEALERGIISKKDIREIQNAKAAFT